MNNSWTNTIDAIVKVNDIPYISKEIFDYAWKNIKKVMELLDGVWWHNSHFWRKLDVTWVAGGDDVVAVYNIPEEEDLW